jgi:hypothetical protein
MMATLLATLIFLFFTGLIQWLFIQEMWDRHDPRRTAAHENPGQQAGLDSEQDRQPARRPRPCPWKISREQNT